MRLLHLVTDRDRRGAQVFGVELARALEARGHEVDVAALAPGSGDPGLPIDALGPTRRSLETARRLRRRMAASDAVIAFGSTTLPASVLAGAGLSTPVVYRSIGDIRDWAAGPVRRRRTAWLLRRCAVVIAQWPAAADALVTSFGVTAERIRVIPRGVDPVRFGAVDEAGRQTSRTALGLGRSGPVLATVGSLTSEKRVHLAIEAASRIAAAQLLVAGDGPERASLEVLAESLAPGRVRFLGVLDDPRDVYAACDLLLLPSATEGIPGAVVEAALTGRPAVATDVGGLSTVVDDGVTGRLVEATAGGTQLADAVRTVLADADGMGAAARRHAVAHFALDTIAERYDELLTAL